MSAEKSWNDWAEAWRDDATAPTTADVEAIERRVRKEQRRQSLRAGADVAGCLVALGVSIWAVTGGEPGDIIIGLAGAAFSLFGLALTLGRRRAPQALASRTVTAALDWEIATARASARSSVGGLITAAMALPFLGLCTFVFQQQGLLERSSYAVGVLGGVLVFTVGAAGTSFWLLRRRRARVARLERLLADLTDETEV